MMNMVYHTGINRYTISTDTCPAEKMENCMYALGVLSGMLLSWGWLVFASPHAQKERKENQQVGVVHVRCAHCGRMSWVSHGDVRVDTKCVRCR